MIYALAAIGALTVAVLMWRAFGPLRGSEPRRAPRPVAPDDDPDFLRKLGEQRKNRGEDQDP